MAKRKKLVYIINTGDSLSQEELFYIFTTLSDYMKTLVSLEGKEVFMGDLKPANILVSKFFCCDP